MSFRITVLDERDGPNNFNVVQVHPPCILKKFQEIVDKIFHLLTGNADIFLRISLVQDVVPVHKSIHI